MIKLWGRNTSSNVMKVIWLLEDLGLPYQRLDVGGPFGGTSTPEYRALQPLGLVPALEDGDFRMFESNAILRYICNQYAPGSSLYPSAPKARAEVETWMDFQQTALNRPMSTVFLGLVRTPPEQRNNAAIAAAIKEVQGHWGVLDRLLAEHLCVVGDTLTLADIVFGPHVHRWFVLDIPGRVELPNLRAWYQRLLARPAFAKHLAITPV